MPRRRPTSHVIATLIFHKIGVVFSEKIDIFLNLFTPQNTSQNSKTVAKFPIFPLYLKKSVNFLKIFLTHFQRDTNDLKNFFSK